jgi:hypothetical protein
MSKEAWQQSSDEDLMENDPEFQKQLDEEAHKWAEMQDKDLMNSLKIHCGIQK